MIATGSVYGRLTVLSSAFAKHGHRYYLCRCECGAELPVRGTRLASGEKTACQICAAAQRFVGKYIGSYKITGFMRSKRSSPIFTAECIQCRNEITIPKEQLRSAPKCACQINREAIISEGTIDPDFLLML